MLQKNIFFNIQHKTLINAAKTESRKGSLAVHFFSPAEQR